MVVSLSLLFVSVGVGMEATEEVRDSEIGEEDEEETYHTANVVDYLIFVICHLTFAFQPRKVKKGGIDDHGDEGPGLFRIPTPITSPGHVRPDSTDEDTGGQAEQSRIEKYLR